MRRLLPFVLLFAANTLPAQSIWDTSVRLAPQFQSYDIKAPFNEKISQISVPVFFNVPVLPALTVDIGTAFATATVKRQSEDGSGNPVTIESEMSGMTDTQVRANYTFGQDFVVLTAGVNLPTGSATVEAAELDRSLARRAATRPRRSTPGAR